MSTSLTSSSGGSIVSGLVSGMDWSTTVSELISNERSSMETALQTRQTTNSKKLSAYSDIKSALTSLQSSVSTLKQPISSWFQQTVSFAKTTSSTTSILSGNSDGTTALGTYTFDIIQPATPTKLQGVSVSETLSNANQTLSSLNVAVPISYNSTDTDGNSYGQFTVDGDQIKIYSTDTLQDVFDKISTATNGTVTATLSDNKVALSSTSGSITVGSGSDTTNFLESMKLYSSNATSKASTDGDGNTTTTYTLSSAGGLGALNISTALKNVINTSNLTGLTNDKGSFTINGKTINYNINTDSVQSIMNNIDQSGAGVTATYNTGTGTLTLKNTSGGSTAISLSDSTGILTALGLSASAGATTTYGQNCIFTVDGSSTELTSTTNKLTPDVTGIQGLTVNVGGASDTTYPYSDTCTIGNSTSKASSMINNFITAYNTVHDLLAKNTKITVNADKSISTGTLSGSYDVQQWDQDLSNMIFKSVDTGISTVSALYQIGLDCNSSTGDLSITDQTELDDALNNNPTAVAKIFNTAVSGTGSGQTGGIAGLMYSYINQLTLSTGDIQRDEDALNTENTDIQKKLTQDETKVSQDQATLIQGFQAMENAISKFNQASKAISAIG